MSHGGNEQGVGRRRFLQVAGGAAVWSALRGRLAAAEASTSQPATLAKGVFGRTKFEATRVSFGAIMLAPPHGVRLLKAALDAGINTVHTSTAYGEGKSVAAIGEFLKRYPDYREKLFLCLKCSTPTEQWMDDALKSLNTDRVDIIMASIHKPDQARLDAIAAFGAAMVAKGKTRFNGFATHGDVSGVIELILAKTPDTFDGALISMAAVGAPGPEKTNQLAGEERARFLKNVQALRGKGVGVMSMKSGAREAVLRGATLFGPHCKAVIEAGADTVLTSLGTLGNVETVQQTDLTSLTMTPYERRVAEAFRCGDCMMCGRCASACPAGVPVNDVMRVASYPAGSGWAQHAASEFADLGLTVDQVVGTCEACTACSAACPATLASARRVRQVVQRFARA